MDLKYRYYYYLGGVCLENGFREEVKKRFPEAKFHFTDYIEREDVVSKLKKLQPKYKHPYYCLISIYHSHKEEFLLFLYQTASDPKIGWHCYFKNANPQLEPSNI